MEEADDNAGRSANPPRERSEIEAEYECMYYLSSGLIYLP